MIFINMLWMESMSNVINLKKSSFTSASIFLIGIRWWLLITNTNTNTNINTKTNGNLILMGFSFVLCCGVVWCSLVWFGVVWCGLVWCGVVWCGVVWFGLVWCGVVWYFGCNEYAKNTVLLSIVFFQIISQVFLLLFEQDRIFDRILLLS